MFVRKKRNKSGTISVQVIQKDTGYKVIRTIGSSSDANTIERMVIQGKQFIKSLNPAQPYLLPVASREDQVVDAFIASLNSSQIHTIGLELTVCGKTPFRGFFAAFGLRLLAALLTVSRRECSFRIASARLKIR